MGWVVTALEADGIQNGDYQNRLCYKKAIFKIANVTKRRLLQILKYFNIFNKNSYVIFYKTETSIFVMQGCIVAKTLPLGSQYRLWKNCHRFLKLCLWTVIQKIKFDQELHAPVYCRSIGFTLLLFRH